MNITKVFLSVVLAIFLLNPAVSSVYPITGVLSTSPNKDRLKSELRKPVISPEAQQKGTEIFHKMVTALGDKEKILNVKNCVWTADITMDSPIGLQTLTVTTYIKYPDKVCMESDTEYGKLTQILNGTKGQMRVREQVQAISPQQVEEKRSNFLRDIIWLVQNETALTFEFLGTTGEGEAERARIRIASNDKRTVILEVNSKTMLPDRFVYNVMTGSSSVEEQKILSNFKEVDGIKLPFNSLIKQGETMIQKTEVKEMKINQELDAEIFTIKE